MLLMLIATALSISSTRQGVLIEQPGLRSDYGITRRCPTRIQLRLYRPFARPMA